jgi:hypothetical protein
LILSSTASHFHVPYQKLLARTQGRPSVASLRGYNKTSDITEESAQLLYIDRHDQLGRPGKRQYIKLAVNSLLRLGGHDVEVSRS